MHADDSYAAVLGLERRPWARRASAVGIFGALFFHSVAAATASQEIGDLGDFAASVEALIEIELRATYEIETVEPPPPPKPEPEPEPPPEPDQEEPVVPETPPPEPAQAGQVLAAEADDAGSESFSVPTGDADRFAGGETSTESTATEPVRDVVEQVTPKPPQPKAKPKPKPKPVSRAVKVELTRSYFARIRSAIDSRKRYPFAARRLGATGNVRISFSISPDGTFQSISVRGSSGHSTLDQAALAIVQSVSGSVARPAALGSTPLRMSVVVHYELDS